ncbi:MAG: cbb3-type cytochrome oxidase assembly protein CcoS [Gemmatimonadales bacterium]|nr:cbb3-type cytochrome oxidase assembly protein CcoS [Gemmatimonadota bacterium]MCL4213116.1 cbb3-type cytochrome oxidase assembly protein CcoS [Gemmatimonadales bacterium]
MSVLYLLVPLALVLAVGFVAAYVWSARQGQFDDLTTPAIRMLHEEPGRPAARSGSPPRRSPPGEGPPPSGG